MRIRAAVLLLIVVLAGCAGLPGSPSPSPAPSLAEQLAQLDGVVSADPSPDEQYLTVTIDREASDDAVLASAREASRLAREAGWPGRVTFVRATTGLDPQTDIAPPAAWTQDVYPGDPDDVAATFTVLLAVEKVPDVATVGISAAGWPSVGLASLDTFAATFRLLSALPAFADGATYVYLGEQPKLVVVHLPERMTAEAIEAVIRIAVENPQCEVELQSLTSPGNRWPELWVAHLTEEQRARVDAQLRDPSLADADPDGYSIPFQLSVPGPDGPVLSWGTFGDVPDTSS